MDRALFTGNPHKVIEGLIIVAYAVGSHRGFIYTRHDSPQLIEHIERALAQAEEYGLLGEDTLGSGFDLHVDLHFDVGIFVSGESSALMRSIEGNPPEPRPKYIRTSVSGIWDQPVTTEQRRGLGERPQIISRGAEWCASIGTEVARERNCFVRPREQRWWSRWEHRLDDHPRYRRWRCGRKGACRHFGPMEGPSQRLINPLDLTSWRSSGPIGAGGLLVMDDETDAVEVARYLLTSSPKIVRQMPVPGRHVAMLKILTNITKGKERTATGWRTCPKSPAWRVCVRSGKPLPIPFAACFATSETSMRRRSPPGATRDE